MMNRRLFCLTLAASSLPNLGLSAKKTKGKNKKKDNNALKTITGTIILKERGITKNYRIIGPKSYTFSRAQSGKVKPFVDQKVSIVAKVQGDKVLVLESIFKA